MESHDPSEPIRSFRDLIVWQRSRELAIASKQVSDRFPRRAAFLDDQILRACASISGGIAEGRGRLSKADNARFLCVSRASLNELESHVELACDWGFVEIDQTRMVRSLATEVERMLNSQIRKLGNRRLTRGDR